MSDILSKKEKELKVLIEWFEKNLERINIKLIEAERCESGKRVFLLSKNCGQLSFTISRKHIGGGPVGNSYHDFYLYDIPTINQQNSSGRYEAPFLQEKLTALHEMLDFVECQSDLNSCFGKFLPSQLRMASLSSINFEREANLCGLINEYIFENGETEEVKKFREKHNSDEEITKSKIQWSKFWLQRN